MSGEVRCTGTHQEGARPKVMGESQKWWGGRDEDACFHGPLPLQPSTRICVAFRCCVFLSSLATAIVLLLPCPLRSSRDGGDARRALFVHLRDSRSY